MVKQKVLSTTQTSASGIVGDSPEGPLKQMSESRLKPAKNQSQTHLA
jgi:hypothetical protein